MNSRERYLETLLFGSPDRVPLQPGTPRESTLAVWATQGFTEGRNYLSVLEDEIGVEVLPEIREDHGASFRMIPEFEEKVLEHKDGHYIVQDWMGAIVEISDKYDCTYLRRPRDFVTRRWIKFPVASRQDWEKMAWRYDPDSEGRLPADCEQRCQRLRGRDFPLSIQVNGPFWQMREWLGMEYLCMAFLTEPDFVREMIVFWSDFVSRTLSRLLSQTTADVLLISEDMAFKQHSFLSPKMTEEFLAPTYGQWIDRARSGGVQVFEIDSDGYIGDLIPIWIDVGINCCSPIEVAASCDVVKFRKRFGNKMAYRGAIDKRLIAKGGQALHDEIMRIVPEMYKTGGFIPSCDHGVPPDISWPKYLEYVHLLARLSRMNRPATRQRGG